MGPVGIADQLSAPPSDPTAHITSNRTLVMATCALNGVLLQPSYPATPLDDTLLGHSPMDVYTTHTAVAWGLKPSPTSWGLKPSPPPSMTPGYFFTALAWSPASKHGFNGANFSLLPRHLASMVDEGLTAPDTDPHAFEDPMARVRWT